MASVEALRLGALVDGVRVRAEVNGELRQELRHRVDQATRARTGQPVDPEAPDLGRTPHGSQSGYRKGCRCLQCTLAARDAKQRWRNAHRAYYNEQNRNYRRRKRAEGAQSVPPTEAKWHGTVGGYINHSCRCERCTEAQRVQQAEYRERVGDYRKRHVSVIDGKFFR
jgi:hypothetical protein